MQLHRALYFAFLLLALTPFASQASESIVYYGVALSGDFKYFFSSSHTEVCYKSADSWAAGGSKHGWYYQNMDAHVGSYWPPEPRGGYCQWEMCNTTECFGYHTNYWASDKFSCPSNKVWVGPGLYDCGCPSGTIWNGTSCGMPTCQTGQEWNGASCVALPQCAAGERLPYCPLNGDKKDHGNPDDCQNENGPPRGAGNPINSATGNKYQHEIDYTAAVGGLSFERSYNSKSNFNGVLGYGWRHHWQASLKRYDHATYGSHVVVTRPNGQSYYFTLSGGNWVNEADITARLIQTGGNYVLTDGASTRETYNSAGQLLSMQSAGGESFTLAYSNNLLSRVTDQFSRSLVLTYNGQGRVDAFTDPANQVTSFNYDAVGNLASVTYPGNVSRTYHYENTSFPHALTGITDEDGVRYVTWGYDSQGRATSSTHAGGADATTLSYNANGTTIITDALGLVRTRSFTELFSIKKSSTVTQPCSSCGGSSASATYDANGFVASRTDFNGHVTNYTHDSRGLETSRTEAVGIPEARTITTSWHSSFRLPLEVNEPGRRAEYTYDSNGNRLSQIITDTATSESRTTTYTYTAQGLLDTVNGPRTDVSDVTDFDYNSLGNLTSVTNALNQVTQITSHDSHGNPLTIVDPNGVTTTLAYDLRQRLTSRTNAGATTGFEYDNAGNLTRLTLPTGTYLDYSYDAAHRLTDIRDNLNNRIHYTLDDAGNRIQERVYDPSNSLKRQLSQEYDNQSRLKKILGANGQVTEFGYDDQGNRTSSTEAGTYITATDYDALDRILKATDAANGETTYGYNDLDQLTSVTDPKGLGTTYTLNAFGGVTSQTSPDTGLTNYTYDNAGNRTSQTDARSITVSYSYDALNRITKQDYPGTAEDVTYFYDGTNYGTSTPNGIGRLTGIQDQSGSTRYVYNPRGTIQEEVRTIRNVIYRTRYEYDAADRLVRLTYPNGRLVDYARDVLGQITQISTMLPGNSVMLANNVGYLPFGAATNWSLGNGVSASREYDQDYRITQIQASGLQDLRYYYDSRNNIEAIQDNLGAGRSQNFSYDALSRLGRAQDSYGTLAYSYDGVGNRLSETDDGVTSNYSYDDSSHRLQSITQGSTTTAFSYDASGNTIRKGDMTFSYNHANRLSGVSDRKPIAQYIHNAHGQRVLKSAGKQITLYHYDQNGLLIAESDSQGKIQKEYVYLNGQLLAQFAYRKQGKKQVYDSFYYHLDHLGTPQLMSDASGRAVWRAAYAPFGQVTITADKKSKVENNHRFPGQYADSETGLHQNWHRDYASDLGRYLQSDPIGLNGGPSMYAYVDSNPLSYTDPMGLMGNHGGPQPRGPSNYERARDIRDWTNMRWPRVPGDPNDPMRHCVTACLIGADIGTNYGRMLGVANEAAGFAQHDLPSLREKSRNNGPWAFQWNDLQHNEKGFRCSKKEDECPQPEETNMRMRCIRCCQKP